MLPAIAGGAIAAVAVIHTANYLPPARADRRPPGAWRAVAISAAAIALSIGVWFRSRDAVAYLTQLGHGALLLAVTVIDLEHSLVPNKLVLAGLAWGVLAALWGGRLGGALGGAAVGGILLLLLSLLQRGALGAGDVKLGLVLGLMTGFPGIVQALVLGIIIGGAAAAVLLATRTRRAREYMPYAPYLAAGTAMTLLYGPRIAAWYWQLVGLGR